MSLTIAVATSCQADSIAAASQQHALLRLASGSTDVCNCCRFVQSNAYKTFLDRGYKLKYNEFGTARPALESLPVIAAGILGIGQGES